MGCPDPDYGTWVSTRLQRLQKDLPRVKLGTTLKQSASLQCRGEMRTATNGMSRTHIVNRDGVSLGCLLGTFLGHEGGLDLKLGGWLNCENADRRCQQREPEFGQLHASVKVLSG